MGAADTVRQGRSSWLFRVLQAPNSTRRDGQDNALAS